MSEMKLIWRALRHEDRVWARRMERGAAMAGRPSPPLAAQLRSGEVSLAVDRLVREQRFRERQEASAREAE